MILAKRQSRRRAAISPLLLTVVESNALALLYTVDFYIMWINLCIRATAHLVNYSTLFVNILP